MLIDKDEIELAVRLLHTAYGLDEEEIAAEEHAGRLILTQSPRARHKE